MSQSFKVYRGEGRENVTITTLLCSNSMEKTSELNCAAHNNQSKMHKKSCSKKICDIREFINPTLSGGGS